MPSKKGEDPPHKKRGPYQVMRVIDLHCHYWSDNVQGWVIDQMKATTFDDFAEAMATARQYRGLILEIIGPGEGQIHLEN